MVEKQQRLSIVPITIKNANVFVQQHHRHHKPLKIGYFFALSVIDQFGKIRGVAIVGRPVARALEDGVTAEVRRVATDGCSNACSALYAAAWRAAKAMGYRKLITYILESEPGTSLRAAGWKMIAKTKGGSWTCPSRPRVDKHPTEAKSRWEIEKQ